MRDYSILGLYCCSPIQGNYRTSPHTEALKQLNKGREPACNIDAAAATVDTKNLHDLTIQYVALIPEV